MRGFDIRGIGPRVVRRYYDTSTTDVTDDFHVSTAAVASALVACGRLLGVDHPQTMMSALGLGDAYAALGLDDLATEVHGGVHAAAARTLGPDHELTLAAAGRPSRRHVPGADA